MSRPASWVTGGAVGEATARRSAQRAVATRVTAIKCLVLRILARINIVRHCRSVKCRLGKCSCMGGLRLSSTKVCMVPAGNFVGSI